jgi:hypothetical protein
VEYFQHYFRAWADPVCTRGAAAPINFEKQCFSIMVSVIYSP